MKEKGDQIQLINYIIFPCDPRCMQGEIYVTSKC